jgi:methionine-rich copper-binding protein CopC
MRRLLLAFAVLLAVLAPAAPAWAHNELIGSTPADGATLTRAPATISLRFLQRLNPRFTTIVVSDAARRRVPAGAPVVDGGTGTITLEPAPGNGVYTVAYRIVSVDGHTVQGDYDFTVADPSLPPASLPASAPPVTAAAERGSGLPIGVLAGAGVVVVLLAGLAIYFLRRRPAA